MSPTQASPADDRDFPRLNGRNFVIWKTRVTAALDGKNLLGFVTKEDYAGESELSDDDDLDPALFDANLEVQKTLDDIGAPKDDPPTDSSSSEASDDDSLSVDHDGDTNMGQAPPSPIQSFTAKKRDELKRAKKLKAKSLKLSSMKLRRMEAKAKAFLIKTIDDQHVLMVKEKATAFEIFQTLCSKYEGAAIHGDLYYIQSYLMALKYEEGTDLTEFIMDLETAMKATTEATNSVLSDEQKSLYLYHSLPAEWKPELAVWKGSKKYIPYEDLKRNIETKVHNELARNRYIRKQGTPETRETRNEKALQATTPTPAPVQETMALASTMKCTYCHRENHETIDCYIIQRHLHSGQVKAGTILPANFKLKPPQTAQREHPYKGNYNGKGGNQSRYQSRNFQKGPRDGYRGGNRNGNSANQGRNKFHGRRNQDNDNSGNSDYGIIAISTADLSPNTDAIGLAAQEIQHDPVWTVDSGCTRHVTSSRQWFVKLTPTVGKAITVGGNHQIPIKGTGDVKLSIQDTKGIERVITLNDVLYAPDLKFNLLSVRQAVQDDFKISFPDAKKCVMFFAHRSKFEAKSEIAPICTSSTQI